MRPGFWLACLILSLGAHAAAFLGLRGQAGPAKVRAMQTVRVSLQRLKEPEPPPSVEAPKQEPPPPTPEPTPKRPMPSSPPQPSERTPPDIAPAESTEAPVELLGVTLTALDGSSGWGTNSGNGAALNGPQRVPTRQGKPSQAPPAEAPRAKGPRVVSLKDLSRRPNPPNLAGQLLRHYPKNKRKAGIEGQARLRARIDADGKVRVTQLKSSTAKDFAAACQRTLRSSKWSPPLDQNGARVATWILYTCQFRIDR